MKAVKCIVVAILALVALAVLSEVPVDLTEEDRVYIEKILAETNTAHLRANSAPEMTFDQQIAAIRQLQEAAFAITPGNFPSAINFLTTREPKDLYYAKQAWCYDRSRLIEKLATYVGFETRHLAVYETTASRPALLALIVPRTPSHALSEIKTARGWIAVDSVYKWFGLDRDGKLLSIHDLAASHSRRWHPSVPESPHKILLHPFTYVIGLYSRHGLFYPPYIPFPEANFRQLLANVSG